MHDCPHCGGEPCLTLAPSHYCGQSSCRSLATPPAPLMLTLPGHFNCNPRLKVFIKFSLSPASFSVRSAACRPDRQSSEEHLQFKRDAYARAVSGLKVNRLLPTPRTVSPLQGVWCLLHPIVRNAMLPARLFAHSLSPTAARLARRRGKLAGAALAQWLSAGVLGLPRAK